jgi:chloramphenicol-sensitive protein RarD
MLLALSGTLVIFNWLIFVWAVTHDQILATSLGYFIGPLVNFLLGFLFLKERLTRIQGIGVVIAATGTLYLGWFLGAAPWISLSLAFSFGFYGLLRKKLDVGPMIGLLWETLLLAPAALVFIAWSLSSETLSFGQVVLRLDILLALAGLVTILPLIWFNLAARTLTLTFYGEEFTQGHAVAFGCIWFALFMVSFESLIRSKRNVKIATY